MKIINKNLIIFLFSIISIKSNNLQNVNNTESLFNYIKLNYLNPNEPYKNLVLHYLLIDFDNYTQKNQEFLSSFESIIQSLFKKYYIKNFLFIFNSNYNEYTEVVYKIYRYLGKNNVGFDPESTISTLISINLNKINIIRGNKIKRIINDKETNKLAKNFEIKLKLNNNISGIIIEYYKNIFNLFRANSKIRNSFVYIHRFVFSFIVYCIVIIITIKYFYKSFYQFFFRKKKISKNDKIKIYLDKCKIYNDRSNSICVICLNKFNIGGEKIILPCGHLFHFKCIFKWFKKEVKCPLCNEIFNLNNTNNKKENENLYNKSQTIGSLSIEIKKDSN